MQEQMNDGNPSIAFYFDDNKFVPDYYMWRQAVKRDVYPVRINDAGNPPSEATAATMVLIQPHPVTGAPAFGPSGCNTWYDPQNRWGQNGQPLVTGSSTLAGVRYG